MRVSKSHLPAAPEAPLFDSPWTSGPEHVLSAAPR